MTIVARWVARGLAAGLLAVALPAPAAASQGAVPPAAATGASSTSPTAPADATRGAFVHGMAWGAVPKYPAGFRHFDYANPDAPRGCTLTLEGFGSCDTINPITRKGVVAAGVGS
ncbi:MAG: hypothetical protein ACK54X_06565, partial [Burkholderiales bacterium]